ncbi:MAG TPA: HhH-GPD-type base excision DNA repair protein [Sporichthyaceae bacterium]|nr:HhH-GPD-type base excision DNA repair protein [Sporichthyaceae bacterium]
MVVRKKPAVRLCLAQQPAADELLSRDPFALVAGMVLDQQFPLERAFAGPRVIADRLGVDTLDVHQIAALDPAEFAALCARTPAVHRFPGSMAGRIQAVATQVIEVWGGDVTKLWATAGSGAELRARLRALPGFGEQKARIFLALLGKQCGITPPGWQEAAEPYGTPGSRRSVADITDAETLREVRAHKQEMKRAAKADGAAESSGAAPRAPVSKTISGG